MIHCSRAYRQLLPEFLKAFCMRIYNGYYNNNPPFIVIPVPVADYLAQIDAFEAARVAFVNGGANQKGDFLIKMGTLIASTDKLAYETDLVAQGNTVIIELAEFEPTHARSEGVKPLQCIVEVKRGIAGELIPSCEKIDNASYYICIMTAGAPLPEGSAMDANGRLVWTIDPLAPPVNPPFSSLQVDFTSQRTKHFQNLDHDTTYYFYFFAVNATGVGPVSEVVSMVCW
jgi:hypothetical protein